MQLSALMGFALVAATLIAVPGADWAFVVAAGARDHVVVPAVAGLVLGYALITAVVAIGVGPIVAALPAALTALTVAGASYLGHLGIRTLRSSRAADPAPHEAAGLQATGNYVRRGFGVSALNPKALLIFLSILPQFARPSAGWPLPVQLATLGTVFILIAAAFYVPLGFASERALANRPRAQRATTTIAGIAMIVLALAVLVERLVAQ